MKPTLCVLTLLSVMLWAHPGLMAQENTATPVGEVVDAGCQKSWRKDKKGTITLLHRTRDKGDKIYEGESYSCEGKGILKLTVYSRAVDVTPEMGWHPIGRPGGEDKPNTAGPPGDELAWLEGSYQLSSDEGEKAERATAKALASLTTEERQKLMHVFGVQLMSPRAFTVIPKYKTLNVMLSPSDIYSLKVDGIARAQQLPDGSGLTFKATADQDKLLLTSFGGYFNAAMKVEPKDDGEKLAVTRTIFVNGRSKPVSWTAVYDRQPMEMVLFSSKALNTHYRFDVDFEPVTAELQETITTEGLTESEFSLKVTASNSFAGGIITGRIAKTVIEPAAKAALLHVDFHSIRLPDGTTKPFRGVLKEILSPTGAVVVSVTDLIKHRVGDDANPPVIAGSQATYTLTSPLVIEKGSKIELYFRATP